MARPIDPFREMERLVNGLTPRATGTVSMPMNLYLSLIHISEPTRQVR